MSKEYWVPCERCGGDGHKSGTRCADCYGSGGQIVGSPTVIHVTFYGWAITARVALQFGSDTEEVHLNALGRWHDPRESRLTGPDRSYFGDSEAAQCCLKEFSG